MRFGKYIRPPYATEEIDKYLQCADCKACLEVCETGIIKISNDGVFLDFSIDGCTYCNECVNACEKGVLSFENKKDISAKFYIEPSRCIAWQGVVCSVCKDACDEVAIRFYGFFYPEIVADKCTACGFCVGVCPTNGIAYSIK